MLNFKSVILVHKLLHFLFCNYLRLQVYFPKVLRVSLALPNFEQDVTSSFAEKDVLIVYLGEIRAGEWLVGKRCLHKERTESFHRPSSPLRRSTAWFPLLFLTLIIPFARVEWHSMLLSLQCSTSLRHGYVTLLISLSYIPVISHSLCLTRHYVCSLLFLRQDELVWVSIPW